VSLGGFLVCISRTQETKQHTASLRGFLIVKNDDKGQTCLASFWILNEFDFMVCMVALAKEESKPTAMAPNFLAFSQREGNMSSIVGGFC
jgi:hypothetical protein